jgi:hypothetical protein
MKSDQKLFQSLIFVKYATFVNKILRKRENIGPEQHFLPQTTTGSSG